MATLKSTEYTNATDGSGTKNVPSTNAGVTFKYAKFTGSNVNASDTIEMMTIPSGVRILPQSLAVISDLEASATVNVGWKAHTTQSDGSAVAADADAFISAVAAHSAATNTQFLESTTYPAGYVTTGELVLTISLGAGTAVSADTFELLVLYSNAN